MRDYTKSFSEAFEDFQKAIRNRSHLVPKQIVDKNGVSRTVMVRPDKDMPKQKKPGVKKVEENASKVNYEKFESDVFSFGADGEKAFENGNYSEEYKNKVRNGWKKFDSSGADPSNAKSVLMNVLNAQKKYDDDKAFEEYKKLASKGNLTNEEVKRVGELVHEHFKHSDKTWPGGAALKQKL